MKTNDLASPKTQSYFASSNGGRGFTSYFGQIFDNSKFERLYILKGGPGTGKSSIMRNMYELALGEGAICELILCSSDPDSLDGLIITTKKGKMGILDGTAPHTRDTLTPGAIDEIIDLGRFWDSGELTKYKTAIVELNSKKRNAYENAYSILASALGYLQRKNEILRSCLDKIKLENAIGRLLGSKTAYNEPFTIEYKLNNAISAKGPYSCELYENMFDRSIAVYGSHGANFAVFDEIREYTQTHKMSITLSPSPLCSTVTDGIALNSIKTAFFDAGRYKPAGAIKSINSERFINEEKLRESKPTLRMLTKLYEESMECAYKELAKSRIYHFSLEEIYTSSMKFEQMNIVKEYLRNVTKAFCT